MRKKDLDSTNPMQPDSMRYVGDDLSDHVSKQIFLIQIYDIENISISNNSQYTIILVGGGLVRARNIATRDRSVQLISSLSNAMLQKLIENRNRNL
jgi:hypothetical protein